FLGLGRKHFAVVSAVADENAQLAFDEPPQWQRARRRRAVQSDDARELVSEVDAHLVGDGGTFTDASQEDPLRVYVARTHRLADRCQNVVFDVPVRPAIAAPTVTDLAVPASNRLQAPQADADVIAPAQ